jgi:predicted RNA-binding protein
MKIKKYNIEVTKPWSKEMYAHNDEVLREVVEEVKAKWLVAYHDSENEYYIGSSDDEAEFQDAEWEYEANAIMKDIQESVLVTAYGSGFTIHNVHNEVHQELEAMPYWRAKEVADELSINLSKEFIGLG